MTSEIMKPGNVSENKAKIVSETGKNVTYQAPNGRYLILPKGVAPERAVDGKDAHVEPFTPQFAPADPENPDGKYVYMTNALAGRKVLLEKANVEAFQNGEADLRVVEDTAVFNEGDVRVPEGTKAYIVEESAAAWESGIDSLQNNVSGLKLGGEILKNKLGALPETVGLDQQAMDEIYANPELKNKLQNLEENEVHITNEIQILLEEAKETAMRLVVAKQLVKELETQHETIGSEAFYNQLLEQNDGDVKKTQHAVAEAKTFNAHEQTRAGMNVEQYKSELASIVEKI